jgi:hypothetical protein
MKNHRIRMLVERAAGIAGIPDALIRDIAPRAQHLLETTGRAQNPQNRDIIWAVDRSRREWSHRFLAALEARGTRPDAALQDAA